MESVNNKNVLWKSSAITSSKGFDKMKKVLAICSILFIAGSVFCSCGMNDVEPSSDVTPYVSDNDHDKRITNDDYDRRDGNTTTASYGKDRVKDAVDGVKDAGEDVVRGAGDAAEDIIDGLDGKKEK